LIQLGVWYFKQEAVLIDNLNHEVLDAWADEYFFVFAVHLQQLVKVLEHLYLHFLVAVKQQKDKRAKELTSSKQAVLVDLVWLHHELLFISDFSVFIVYFRLPDDVSD
jgi:hypothetical protein